MHKLPHVVFDVVSGHHDVDEVFALDVAAVTQVIFLQAVVPVPLAPNLVRGIMNHNGRIVTIVDPAPLLGLPKQQAESTHVLLLRRDERRHGTLGLVVLRIREIVAHQALRPAEVKAGPCIGWVAHVGQRLIHVVALEPLLQKLNEHFHAKQRGELGEVGV